MASLKTTPKWSSRHRAAPESYLKFSARGTEVVSECSLFQKLRYFPVLTFSQEPTLRRIASILLQESESQRKKMRELYSGLTLTARFYGRRSGMLSCLSPDILYLEAPKSIG